ncbi:MAG: biopolymer transporter ExbD [Verrucomicrobiota bacterium]|nr:biopolymer transporter ExbD [Verrucomicrobiota bacterium]
MELIPQEEIKTGHQFNFAPMIDFLFLMLALFATLAISRAALLDTEVELAELKADKANTSNVDRHPIHLSITAEGKYKWLTEFQEYPMISVDAVQEELARQYKLGVLPQDHNQTEVLLHIDRKAPWDSIAKLLFGVREVGFPVRPVYEAN